MKTFWILISTIYFATATLSKSCLEVKLEQEKNCQEGDLGNYINCVRTRMKRQFTNCKYDDQCFDCDCESCQYSRCDGQCSDCCNSCCTNYVQCHTNHCCHRQCHSECRTYNCRSSCRKSCYDSISREKETKETEVEQKYIERIVDRTLIGSGGTNIINNNNKVQSNSSNVNSHNITTVINLKNVINNTNLIDVPINLNYTNRNNISLSDAHGGPDSPYSGDFNNDNCCIVIGPRQCAQIQISPYVRCFYLRSKQCGSFCTATIVHKESQTCTVNAYGQQVCQEETSYIPQPQPRCTYSSKWPYVTCGVQRPASCEGCYGHYFSSQVKDYKSCSPQCYNDFGAGPLYRQGPFYQQTYSHLPPCYFQLQGCGGVEGMRGGGTMGGFRMMGPYGEGFSDYFGGFGPGLGGGFGYAAQLPMLQPGMPFPQPLLVSFNPPLRDDPQNSTSNSQTFFNSSELLDGIIIDQYQDNRDGPLAPPYEFPDKEIKIDVTITDPNKTEQIKMPFRRHVKKESNKVKEANVIRV